MTNLKLEIHTIFSFKKKINNFLFVERSTRLERNKIFIGYLKRRSCFQVSFLTFRALRFTKVRREIRFDLRVDLNLPYLRASIDTRRTAFSIVPT